MSKYDDCHRVDNRYTTAIGISRDGSGIMTKPLRGDAISKSID